MTGPTAARTPVPVGTLDVHEWGPADATPVLLLHGFPQAGDAWAQVASKLAGHHLVAPDQRGYSPDARPPLVGDYVLSKIVDDALAVVDDRFGAGARVHVVGHDWGAAVAWKLAARHPDRVRSLTALSVPPLAAFRKALLTSRQGLASWYMGVFQVPGLAERLFRPGDRPYSKRFVAAMRGTGQTRERAERDGLRLADPAALTAAVNWYRAIPQARREGPDPAVPVPTLFVWSNGDTAITRQATARVGEHVAGPYEFVELRGVSHWIPEEAPDALADLLLAHWARHPG